MVNPSRFAFDPQIDKPWGSTLREKLPRSVCLRYVNWRSKERQHGLFGVSFCWGADNTARGISMIASISSSGSRHGKNVCLVLRYSDRQRSEISSLTLKMLLWNLSRLRSYTQWVCLGAHPIPDLQQWRTFIMSTCWCSLAPPICIPQAHGSCSFSLRVFPQGLSIRGSTKNYLRFSI